MLPATKTCYNCLLGSILFIFLSLGIYAQGPVILKTDSVTGIRPELKESFLVPTHYVDQIRKIFHINILKDPELKQKFSAFRNNPVDLKEMTKQYTLHANQNLLSHQSVFSHLSSSSIWSIGGVPMAVTFNDERSLSDLPYSRSTFSLHYKRKHLLKDLQDKVLKNVDVNQFLEGLEDPLMAIKAQAEMALKKDLSLINHKYSNLLSVSISSIPGVDELLSQDFSYLKEKFLNTEYIASILAKERMLAQLIALKNVGGEADSATLANLSADVTVYKGINEIVGVLAEHKVKWEKSGLLEKIKEWEVFRSVRLQELLNDPANVLTLVRKKFNLSGIQRTFLKLDKLKFGNSSENTGDLSLKGFLNKGITAEFLNKNNFLQLLNGKFGDINTIRDQGIVSNIFSSSGAAKAIRLGKGSKEKAFSHISVATFDQSLGGLSGPGLPELQAAWKSLVTTFSKQVLIGDRGIFFAEVSKSSTVFNRTENDNPVNGNNLLEKPEGGDFLSNIAVSVQYENEHPKSGLSYQINLQKVSSGYDNPGNSFLRSGSSEVSMRARKTLVDRKVTMSLRGSMRNYDQGTKWRHLYAMADLRWKFRRGQFVQLRYSPSTMSRLSGIRSKVSDLSRFSLSTNITTRLTKSTIRHNINLFMQRNSYFGTGYEFKNNSLGISLYENIAIGNRLIYFNTVYNHSTNQADFALFNSSLLTEAGFSYPLTRYLNASSALAYQSVTGWFKKIGIRQSINGTLHERFIVNLFFDAGPTRQTGQFQEQSFLRGELGLIYLFKQ